MSDLCILWQHLQQCAILGYLQWHVLSKMCKNIFLMLSNMNRKLFGVQLCLCQQSCESSCHLWVSEACSCYLAQFSHFLRLELAHHPSCSFAHLTWVNRLCLLLSLLGTWCMECFDHIGGSASWCTLMTVYVHHVMSNAMAYTLWLLGLYDITQLQWLIVWLVQHELGLTKLHFWRSVFGFQFLK